jgi:hypothetical protein
LVGLAPDGGINLAIGQDITTVHSGSVEWQGQPAGAVDGNDPAPPAKFAQLINDGARRRIKR